jgi:hypothetical protein
VGSSTVRKTLAKDSQPLDLALLLSDAAIQYRKVYLRVKSNISGEGRLTVAGRSEHRRKVPEARETGSKLKTHGITEKGRKNIQKAGRAFWGMVNNKDVWKGKAFLSELTLTYPAVWPEAEEVERQFKIFSDRLRRYIKKKYGPEAEFYLVWVKEAQKRGAPHYHILTPYFINKNWLNDAWNDIIDKWQEREGLLKMPVYTSVNPVRNIGSFKEYMSKTSDRIGRVSEASRPGGFAKYMTKGSTKQRNEKNELEGRLWGMSSDTRVLLKDKEVLFEANNSEEINEIVWEIGERLKAKKVYCRVFRPSGVPYRMIWCTNYIALFEVLNEMSKTQYKVFEPSELILRDTG